MTTDLSKLKARLASKKTAPAPAYDNTGRPVKPPTHKTATITLGPIKDEGWGYLEVPLGISEETAAEYFQYSEYAKIELVVDAEMNIVGGRVIPIEEWEPKRRARL